MADDRGNRGRKRRGRHHPRDERTDVPDASGDEQQPIEEEGLEISDELEDTTGGAARRIRFGGLLFRRRSAGPRSKRPAAGVPTPSPMDFWRSGQARTYRDPKGTSARKMGIWQRITGFHFPAWVPVGFIVVVVFGILGILFYTRSAIGSPRINDHWHAPYAIYIGGKLQPRIAEQITREGIHTHGDNMIHAHPHIPAGEGSGARLANFFGDQGGKLSESEMQIPGRKETYKNGEKIDGKAAELRILKGDSGIHPLGGNFPQAIVNCNGKPESEFTVVNSRYVPKDGDCIRIIFGPPEVEPEIQQDRTIIPVEQADRELKMEVSGAKEATKFSPETLALEAGETVKVTLTNTAEGTAGGEPFHGLRFAGPDGKYETSDDYVTDPPTLHPGETGVAVIRFETAGEFEFRDEAESAATGKVNVGEPEATPPPDATPAPEEVDVTLKLTTEDNVFSPKELTVAAGKKFRIQITNKGDNIHNIIIAGVDGEFGTKDDLVSKADIEGGGKGELVGQIDKPGSYAFRCSFHRTEHTGTLIVE